MADLTPEEKAVGRPLSQNMREALAEAQMLSRLNPPTLKQRVQSEFRVRIYYPVYLAWLRLHIKVLLWYAWLMRGRL